MQNFEQTVISQYGNSPIVRQLIQNMNDFIRPDADIDSFLSFMMDVDTAQFWGLDRIGKIVGVSRTLKTAPSITTAFMGFKNTGNLPWGQAPFYHQASSTDQYKLSDDAYRTLIRLKMLANITVANIPSLNQIMRNLFSGRGRCYVTDPGRMAMFFVFEFQLMPFEISILTQSGVVPTPTGVLSSAMQSAGPTFGFKQQTGAQPFGHGIFFNRSSDLLPIN